MEKVIVFGVKNIKVRRDVEYFLDDSYQIIGYSDGHYSSDILDGKPFFRPEELCEQKYDFIIVTSQTGKAQAEIRRILSGLGVPSDKIIRPIILKEGDKTKSLPDIVTHIERHYKGEPGLIFGMSYSYMGIYEKKLRFPFFNCSFSGMDIYYNACVFQYMEERGILSTVEKALFVIPYYYFDFDMSRSAGEYEEGFTFSMHRLNDWHSYKMVPGASEYVENYRMFGKKISEYYHVPMWKEPTNCVHGAPDNSDMLEPLWFANHKETESENRNIFAEFYQKIEARRGELILVIPPLYVDGVNQMSKAALQAKKERFYGILKDMEENLGSIHIYDYLDAFSGRRELFRDTTHLNSNGAEEFTKLINRDILNAP